MYLQCLECPRLVPSGQGSRCPQHAAQRAANLERKRQRPSAHTRGYDAEYRRNRAILLADNPSCSYCPRPATTADHVMPLAFGGSNSLENLLPACHPCNSARGGRMNKH